MFKGIKIKENNDKKENQQLKENKQMMYDFLGKKLENKEKTFTKNDLTEKVDTKSKEYYFSFDKTIKDAFEFLIEGNITMFNSLYDKLELNKNNKILNNISTEFGEMTHKFEDFVIPECDFNNVKFKCKFCYSKNNFDLVNSLISNSANIYVSYPYITGSITDHHYTISSFEHINSSASLPDNIYEELKKYKDCITNFNKERGYSTVFLEFSKDTNYHFIIDAIPIKEEFLDEVMLMYEKAFTEQDIEWSENKQIIETFKEKGDLRKFINKNFSYVNVDFNSMGGYLHVISDMSKFSSLFLKEILCTCLDLTIFDLKTNIRLNQIEINKRVEDIKGKYLKYDWVYNKQI